MGSDCCSATARDKLFRQPPSIHAHRIRLNVEIEPSPSSSGLFLFKSNFKGFHQVEDVSKLYSFDKVIGAGVYGKVYEARHLGARQPCALKVIQKSHTEEDDLRAGLLKQELQALERISHPYIVRVMDLFEDDHNIYVALELLPHGNLLQVLTKIKRCGASFTERDAASLVRQMLLAVNYVHEEGLIHRDIKMENVMVDLQPSSGETASADIVCKLSDFGFACMAGQSKDEEQLSCGTPLYMAPEMIEANGYDQKVDVWSLGVIVFAMLTSTFPFNARNKQLIFAQILSKKKEPAYSLLDKYWDQGKLAKDFVSKCLDKDPRRRWSAKQLLNHAWLQMMVAEVELDNDHLVDTGLALLSFKSQSQFQSLLIQYLVGLKAQKSELAQMKSIFLKLDANKDGFLSSEEIQQGMEQVTPDVAGLVGGKPDWGAVAKELDANSDGLISYDEFIVACYDRRSLLNNENLKIAFDLLDVDKDGKIQKRDLAQCLASTSTNQDIDVEEKIWTSLAGEADANQDEEITFKEFKDYLTKHTSKNKVAQPEKESDMPTSAD